MQTASQGSVAETQSSKPRKLGLAIAAVVIAALIVAVIVLSAMVLSPAGTTGEVRPTVTFSTVSLGGSTSNQTATWNIASVSNGHGFDEYQVSLLKDDASVGSTQVLVQGVPIALGTEQSALISDADGDGRLSNGDTILIYKMTGTHAWSFLLLWKDDSLIQAKTWNTIESPPKIAFTAVNVGGSSSNQTAAWSVASSSIEYGFDKFKIQLLKDDVAVGSAQALVQGALIALGPGERALVGDADANGMLSVGDTFLVYNMTVAHTWSFLLLWKDDSLVQTKAWNTIETLPDLTFTSVTVGGSWDNLTAAWNISSVSIAWDFGKFKIRLLKDDVAVGSTQFLIPGVRVGFDAEEWAIVRDIGGDGRLSVGDSFLVYNMTGTHSWVLFLLWYDDRMLEPASWGTEETRPTVIFSPMINQGGTDPNLTATLTVVAVGVPSLFSSFEVNINMDGNPLAASEQTLVAGSYISFGSSTVKLLVTDLGGEGKLTAGDLFFVCGMTSGHAYTLYLNWAADGSLIAQPGWNT